MLTLLTKLCDILGLCRLLRGKCYGLMLIHDLPVMIYQSFGRVISYLTKILTLLTIPAELYANIDIVSNLTWGYITGLVIHIDRDHWDVNCGKYLLSKGMVWSDRHWYFSLWMNTHYIRAWMKACCFMEIMAEWHKYFVDTFYGSVHENPFFSLLNSSLLKSQKQYPCDFT